MPENKLTFRNCIRELLGFVRPYRIRLSIALFHDHSDQSDICPESYDGRKDHHAACQ